MKFETIEVDEKNRLNSIGSITIDGRITDINIVENARVERRNLIGVLPIYEDVKIEGESKLTVSTQGHQGEEIEEIMFPRELTKSEISLLLNALVMYRVDSNHWVDNQADYGGSYNHQISIKSGPGIGKTLEQHKSV